MAPELESHSLQNDVQTDPVNWAKDCYITTRDLTSYEAFQPNLQRKILALGQGAFEKKSWRYIEVIGDNIANNNLFPDTSRLFGNTLFNDRISVKIIRETEQRHKLIRQSLFERAKMLELRKYFDESLDLIYDYFDKLFWDEKWDIADKALREVKVSEYSLDILLAILTSTLPAADKLSTRKKVFNDIEIELRERGDLDDTLLVGLEG